MSRASGRLSTAAGSHAGYQASRFTGRLESRISVTGEKRECRSSCGGFSRLILSWNIRGWNWLPTEGEKVEFIEGLGVHSNLIPRRIYYGAVSRSETLFCAQAARCRGR